jgi:hypothetical protein
MLGLSNVDPISLLSYKGVGVANTYKGMAFYCVPPFQLPGQGGACQANFETGDVLEALPSGVFTMAASNGFSYTLQGIFPTPALLCGPGY